MAKPSEILATLREAGLSPQDSANVYALRRQLDTTDGITEALREQAFLESFGDDVPTYLEDAEVEAPLPTFANILSKLKIENDDKNMKGGRSAVEKFIEDFPKKQKTWKKVIENDPSFGERGWEFVKEAWKQATNDKMRADIESERKKVLAGENLAEKAGMFLTKFFRPRAYEAWERGEDPTWKDQVGDFVESAIMAIPAGKYVGTASRVLSKIPKVGQYAQKVLGNKAVSTILGNAVAPFASEAMDAAMRSEDDPNTQRQDFSLGDALMGTATNLGINFGLLRALGGSARLLEQQIMRNSSGSPMRKAAEFLESIGKNRAERGLPAPTTKWSKVLEAAEMGAPALLVNRMGKDSDAERALAMMGSAPIVGGVLGGFSGEPIKAEVKKLRDEEHKDMQNSKTKKEVEGVKASRILDLDARDVKYLDAVANDPSIVQFGYAPNNDDFKLWLLERGHKLLANTGAHRPIWEAK